MKSDFLSHRQNKLRRQFDKASTDCVILTNPANVTFITGFDGDDSWAIVTPKSVYLITDSRYALQAESQCASVKIILRETSLPDAAAKLILSLKSIKRIAVEDTIPLNMFRLLKKNIRLPIKPLHHLAESIRQKKDPSEIDCVKQAVKIASIALTETLKSVKAGITECELAAILDFNIKKLNAINSFDTIVAFGPNAARPHHKPTTRKLKKIDTILIDFGAKYKNYCCDLTRCFAVGRATPFYAKTYQAVELARQAALNLIKDGAKIADIDSAAKEVLQSCKLPLYGHGTGHGLGLEVHEMPFISKNSRDCLEEGDLITIEPAVYLTGKFGIRIEDDVLVTKTGFKLLSHSLSSDLKIIAL